MFLKFLEILPSASSEGLSPNMDSFTIGVYENCHFPHIKAD